MCVFISWDEEVPDAFFYLYICRFHLCVHSYHVLAHCTSLLYIEVTRKIFEEFMHEGITVVLPCTFNFKAGAAIERTSGTHYWRIPQLSSCLMEI